jgi:hypothetical protein
VVVLGVAWLALHPLWAAAADPAPPTPTDTTTAPPTTQPEAEREPEPVPDEEEVPDEEWQAPDEGEVITARVGARCVDGSLSTATGSGACSHHGGVAAWLISDCTVDDFADHPDEKWIRENCYLEWEPAA